MDKIVETKENKTFEEIKHIERGYDYWFARELYPILEYASWNKFLNVIKKAKIACTKSNNNIDDHFSHVGKMVKTGDSYREIVDYKLSRYACYLIVQNADPNKEVIALWQTYFAVQTRKQELSEKEYLNLNEEEKNVSRTKAEKMIILTGKVSLAGVEIIYI